MDRGHRALLSLLASALLCGGPGLRAAPPGGGPPPAGGPPPVILLPGQMIPLPGPGPTAGLKPMFGPPGQMIPVMPDMQVHGRVRTAIIDAHARETVVGGKAMAARLSRMSPADREDFKKNFPLWQQMPSDERVALRQQAKERNREEISNALRESGLQLNDDQKEVFVVRYSQERRKLERDIQEKANAERTRRLPEILDLLRREFTPPKGSVSTPNGSPAR